MKPPDNAEGPSPCQDSTLNSAPINANAATTVQARDGKRSTPTQTPLARFMLVHEHRPGRRTADAIPLDRCPVCGFQSTHKAEWPPQGTLWKSCTACGFRDEFATIEIKAGSRSRRRA